MGLIDFVLNLAGVLLWLNWRAVRFDPLAGRPAATLASTLKPTEARRGRAWQLLAGVVLLLVMRVWLYWYLSSPADWTPKLDLGVVVLAFRGDDLSSEAVYSGLSFGRVLGVFYFWLMVLVLLQPRAGVSDAVTRWLRLHLGGVSRLAWPVQLVLPVLLVTAGWVGLHPLLMRLGVSNPSSSTGHLVEQGLLVSCELYLSLKFVLVPLLLIDLVSSYVYLGNSPFLEFVNRGARRLLAPVQMLPLKVARVDFAPIAGALVLILVLHWLPMMLQSTMARHELGLWPP